MLDFILIVMLAVLFAAWINASNRAKRAEASLKHETAKSAELSAVQQVLEENLRAARAEVSELAPYRAIQDVEAEVKRLRQLAEQDREAARLHAVKLISDAKQEADRSLASAKEAASRVQVQAREALDKARTKADEQISDAQKQVTGAHEQAQAIIQKAKQDAEQIAGDAYVALQKADSLQKTLQALEGAVKGYGDAYIVPTYSLLDELADEFSHTDAGNNLRRAREHTRQMVLNRTAASCDYVEANRRETAITFVIDAFNGKVDSVLSRVKSDNAGKLVQEIRGAFQLVNHNGAAFRNARVTDAYLAARLDELRWAATAKALQDKEREEQRQLREQIREEERARKEFERAMKEAEKEEAAIQKAMQKVQAQVQKASDEQKAVFEAQLAELAEKLRLAEEKGQRALSMAQQTRVGHVYVISNIGSFGENVYKIGMTRRLEPLDRVRELGDASVPFEFDVHAMIYSEDAPKLEKSLHRHFMRAQVNKVNPRKEFFRVGINDIMEHVESTGIQAHWTLTAKAASFRESQRIEQALVSNTEEGQRWAEIQAETIEADESQEEVELT